MLECVVNISEGRDPGVLARLRDSAGDDLLDVHSDPDHNRSVFTMIGEQAPRRLARVAVQLLTLDTHEGVHPRIGVVDVVPFVPLDGSTMEDAMRARREFAHWVSSELAVPVFLYGPERSLPTVRRDAWARLSPDFGPTSPHPTAGAICAGAREPLIAYNVWLEGTDLTATKRVASQVRSEHLRTLGLEVGPMTQVSMNLISPTLVGPDRAFDEVAALAPVHHAELVGLLPRAILESIPRGRWEELDLGEDRTIEARLEAR